MKSLLILAVLVVLVQCFQAYSLERPAYRSNYGRQQGDKARSYENKAEQRGKGSRYENDDDDIDGHDNNDDNDEGLDRDIDDDDADRVYKIKQVVYIDEDRDDRVERPSYARRPASYGEKPEEKRYGGNRRAIY